MKVVITGAGGQLGLDLLDAYADHDVVGLTHAQLDVADEAAVVAAVRDLTPDLVVHAAAWTDVDGCERDPDRAHRVNALGSWWVARACGLAGAAMVLVSTDYVFDGAVRRPRSEFDPVAPVNAYGASKVAAEQLVRQALARHYIVRTASLFGSRGDSFVRTMLRLGRDRHAVEVAADQIGSPSYTRDVAAAIRALSVTGRYGTYNRTNAGSCSRQEFAAATFELAGLDTTAVPVDSASFGRAAARPAYSVLSDRHSVATGLRPLPDWRNGLARMLTELDEQV